MSVRIISRGIVKQARLSPLWRRYVVLLRFGRRKYRSIGLLMRSGSKMSRHQDAAWRDAYTWDPACEGDLVVQADLAPAAWIGPLLAAGTAQVRAMVPQGFEAYARIFFPFAGDRPAAGSCCGTASAT